MNQEETIKRDHGVAHEYHDCPTHDTTWLVNLDHLDIKSKCSCWQLELFSFLNAHARICGW